MPADAARPIVLLRPLPGLQRTAARLRAAGYPVLEFPLQQIVPVPAATLRRALARPRDWLIFCSRPAARAAAAAGPLPAGGRYAAVGPGTAAALREAGAPSVLFPRAAEGVEAVLALPEFAAPAGQNIAVVAGSGGRRLLLQRLRARGAEVEKIVAYRRRTLATEGRAYRAAARQGGLLVFGNGESLRLWAALADRYRCPEALQLPLVAPSERVVKLATRLGYARQPWVPGAMDDEALLQLLSRHCGAPSA